MANLFVAIGIYLSDKPKWMYFLVVTLPVLMLLWIAPGALLWSVSTLSYGLAYWIFIPTFIAFDFYIIRPKVLLDTVFEVTL